MGDAVMVESWCLNLYYNNISANDGRLNDPSMMSTMCPNNEEVGFFTWFSWTDLILSTIDYFLQYIWKVPAEEGYRVLLKIEQGSGLTEHEMICQFVEYKEGNWTSQIEICKDDVKIPAKICVHMPKGTSFESVCL